ncbi:hypothetical protein D3C81_1428780 [compost metagenome]
MQHIIRGIHAPLGPLTDLGHQIFVKAAVQGLAVGPQVGTRDALHGDDQQVASAAWPGQQPLPVQVGLSQAAAGQRCERLRTAHPAFERALQAADPG